VETVTLSVNALILLSVLAGLLALPLLFAGAMSLVVVWKQQLWLDSQRANEQKPNPNDGDKP
jgi:hypothetical protein